jgi:hypothetical protein
MRITYNSRNIFYQSEYSAARSSRVCDMFGCKNNESFVLKSILKDSPFKFIFLAFGIGIFVFGVMLMIAESPIDRVYSETQMHTLYNSCWEAICSMTTVGFGDIYPRTP